MIRFFNYHWRRRWEKYYHRNRWHLILDIFFILLILALGSAVIILHLYRPKIDLSGTFWNSNQMVVGNPLTVDFSVSQVNILPTDKINLKAAWKNSAAVDIDDIKINILPATRGAGLSSSSISVPQLKAGDTRLDSYEILPNISDPSLTHISWQAQVSYRVAGQIKQIAVSLPEIKIITSLDLSAAAYYHSPQGDQLGTGPLPPVVGLPTNYWIFWNIKSAGNLSDIVVSARLPKGVELMSVRSLLAGDLSFNAASRQLIWKLSSLKAAVDDYRVGFEIQFIPSQEHAGRVPNLLTNINYYAQDDFTGADISGSAANLTADLDFDRINKGQGMVNK